MSISGLNKGQEYFVKSMDKNGDRKLNIEEIKQTADLNRDGHVNAEEAEQFAIKSRAAGLDHNQTQTLLGAIASADPKLDLFAEDSDGTWRFTSTYKTLEGQKIATIPFSRKSLHSRKDEELRTATKGVFHPQDQIGNSCGTTALSMMMKYHQGHTRENSVSTIDTYIRGRGDFQYALPTGKINTVNIDGYTAPREIVDYANDHGLRAGLKNNGSISDLVSMLDKGVPVLTLTDWNFERDGRDYARGAEPDGKSLHWVSVIGYQQKKNPETNTTERVFLIANPHGKIQEVSEKDFDKVWRGAGSSGQLQHISGDTYARTDMKRLFIAMVPQDDNAQIVAPDGTTRNAGTISIPNGSDGFMGWLSETGSELMRTAANFQEDMANSTMEVYGDVRKGYDQDGILGAINNFFNGDSSQATRLKQIALKGDIATKANIIQNLMDLSVTRDIHEDVIYEILKDTSWTDFKPLIDRLDMRQLASEIETDWQAGRIMAWIAKAEVAVAGKTGSKFETFANYLSSDHRQDAINSFMENKYTKEEKLVNKVPAGVIRRMITDLMDGNTSSSEEKTIYELFRLSDWNQFDQIMSKLDMKRVASELESESQLANLTKWVVKSAITTDHWGNLSEILSNLESMSEYLRADNVIGEVVMDDYLSYSDIQKIPRHLRDRMEDLVDDISRGRTDRAVSAATTLKKML